MRAHSLGDLGDRERVESASNASYSDSLFEASKSNLRAWRIYLNEEVWHDLPLDQLPRSEGDFVFTQLNFSFDILRAYSWFDKTCLRGLSVRRCIERSRLASECCFFLLTILNQWFPERLLDTGKRLRAASFPLRLCISLRFLGEDVDSSEVLECFDDAVYWALLVPWGRRSCLRASKRKRQDCLLVTRRAGSSLGVIGSHAISCMLPSSTAATKLASLLGITLYVDFYLIIWNCNMVVLDTGCDLICSYIMSIDLPPSTYILLTLYKAIIVLMTTGLDDGRKVSHGMLCDRTFDQFSIISLPLYYLSAT
ncbi:hypothetical protein Tco_1415867, partial [Tanacetum coccineum]